VAFGGYTSGIETSSSNTDRRNRVRRYGYRLQPGHSLHGERAQRRQQHRDLVRSAPRRSLHDLRQLHQPQHLRNHAARLHGEHDGLLKCCRDVHAEQHNCWQRGGQLLHERIDHNKLSPRPAEFESRHRPGHHLEQHVFVHSQLHHRLLMPVNPTQSRRMRCPRVGLDLSSQAAGVTRI